MKYHYQRGILKPAKGGSATTVALLLFGALIGFYAAVRVAEGVLIIQ